ncbi:MAG: radical SAM protein [Candidatus Aureabacteria bacterium]|nr:radical SAM protein [Candidatus Auribacterota bacterium]
MKRYSVYEGKYPREVLLLKSFPCGFKGCSFCDCASEHSKNEKEIIEIASAELDKVTGVFRRLEVLNSASFFDFPVQVWQIIKDTVERRGIEELIVEANWNYKKRFKEITDFFNCKIRVKVGVETFDHKIRKSVMKKEMEFSGPKEIIKFTDSIRLLVGLKGQTQKSIRNDISIALSYFDYISVNLLHKNRKTSARHDSKLIEWFNEEYKDLHVVPGVEVLIQRIDLGVGRKHLFQQ